MRIRIYQNSAAKLGRGMHGCRPQSSLFNLCIVSRFLSALWTSLFSLFHLPLYFFIIFCVHWHVSNCTELPQRKCSPTHEAVTVTLLIHPIRHVAGCTITLSQQDRNEQGHTQSIWDGTENLHLAASHCGPHIQDPHIVLLRSFSAGLGWSTSIITTSVRLFQILHQCQTWWFTLQLAHYEHALRGKVSVDLWFGVICVVYLH